MIIIIRYSRNVERRSGRSNTSTSLVRRTRLAPRRAPKAYIRNSLDSRISFLFSSPNAIDWQLFLRGSIAMPQVDTETCAATLKAVTYRLAATPSKQLPRLAAQIAGSLWNCRQLLSRPSERSKQNSENTVIVTRFRTHLASLLQDRTVEGRWVAVVLVKATIEAGGVESLSKSNALVKSLLTILKKPDPPTTRILAVLTLTRIFSLTWNHTNLIREVTTPALPGFVSTCLSNAENARCSGEESQAILEAFAVLIPRHPTIFRASESQIQILLLKIIFNTDVSRHYTHEHQRIAGRVMVLLHHCAPKQGAAEQRDQSFKRIIASAHETCDHLYRAIVEDWQSTAGVQPSAQAHALVSGEVELEHDRHLGLSSWSGVSAGSERLIALLSMLKMYIGTTTAAVLNVRLGLLADLLSRILSATAGKGTKLNMQIARDEKEVLFVSLPSVHVEALHLIEVLLNRFGRALPSMMQPLLPQVIWVFQAEKYDVAVRTAAYIVIDSFLRLQGLSLAREDAADLEPVTKSCYEDLAPQGETKVSIEDSTAKPPRESSTGSRDSQSFEYREPIELTQAAANLIPDLIANVDPSHISRRLRTQLERTAVLSGNKSALVACVLNPMNAGTRSVTQPSLLPVLARQFPSSIETEVLLRPRMPVIRVQRKVSNNIEVTRDSEAEEEEGEGAGGEIGSETAEQEAQIMVEEDVVFDGQTMHDSNVTPVGTGLSTDPSIVPAPFSPVNLVEKRPAPSEHLDFGPDATKRPRTSPSADEVMPREAAPTLSAETISFDQSEVSSKVVPVASEQAIVVPAATLTSTPRLDLTNMEEDDDEEMEIPTLTMEESSDEE
nr:pre-rrna-processing protein rix1 [Quercus suber]